MTIYNYFINFLEGLLLSSFMAYYFNVKRKKMYIFSKNNILIYDKFIYRIIKRWMN